MTAPDCQRSVVSASRWGHTGHCRVPAMASSDHGTQVLKIKKQISTWREKRQRGEYQGTNMVKVYDILKRKCLYVAHPYV